MTVEAEPLRAGDRALHRRAAFGSNLLLVGVSLCVLALDQATKLWAIRALSGLQRADGRGTKRTLIRGFFDFSFAQNPGGAWSFLRDLPDGLRRPFFLVVSSVASVLIVSVYGRLKPEQSAVRWGLALSLGGALGNLVDRIRFGWVVDFIDFYMIRSGQPHHWPTFNVADVAICVGVGLMCADLLWPSHGSGHPKSSSAASGA